MIEIGFDGGPLTRLHPQKHRQQPIVSWLFATLFLAAFALPHSLRADDDGSTSRRKSTGRTAINQTGNSIQTSKRQASGKGSKALARFINGNSPRNLDDLVALQKRIHALSPELIEKTVAVQVGRANGSGVIVSKDGYVLTAAHVAGTPDRKAIVYLSDGRQVEGITLGLNEVLDAGLLKITEPGKWPYAELGKSEKLNLGQWCLATGHPGGYDPTRKPTLRMGRILKAEKSAILTDCTLVGGDSGGPLFDLNGDVIGIHSRIGKNLTVNVHVPVDRYRKSWSRLVKGEAWDLLSPKPNRSWIGVIQDTESESGVRIKKVLEESPAKSAGLKPGDEIRRFNNIQITDFAVLKKQVQLHAPGERVTILIRRSGKLIELTLKVGSYPEREIGK